MSIDGDFAQLVELATGHAPYPYQTRLAHDRLPELLKVPTGCGKTLGATLPWLFRRRFHPDATVRASTPHWLVFTLPMRTLVEQTFTVVTDWVDRLGLAEELPVYRVMGGETRVDATWRDVPDRDAIFVGTLDMLVSRALNRGYGASRFVWPIDFGLFSNGCQWVFDEVQLMGPALPTSRQLDGLRRVLGSAIESRSMWMSATVGEHELGTVDNRDVGATIALDEADLASGLAARLDAGKRVEEVRVDESSYEQSIAAALRKAHVPATLMIGVCNTVDRARGVFAHLRREAGSDGPELVLLHSRFRPPERRAQVDAALAPVEAGSAGRIVVSTQVIEAGVDISAAVLFTEAAPWPSIVQRAGRCNRDGLTSDARLLWAAPPRLQPYEPRDIEATIVALRELEDERVTPASLAGREVAVKRVIHPVLRRRDLVDLFDTTPDLSGNDLDVSRFIRAGDDLDLQVAWRVFGSDGPSPRDMPTRDELCPVPVRDLRDAKREAWVFDHLDASWMPADASSLRPGRLVLLRAGDGGYDPALGWDPKHKDVVQVLVDAPPDPLALGDAAIDDDPVTFSTGRWVGLAEHLADVEREAEALAHAYAPDGLGRAHLEAAAIAGRLHDIGKAHDVFQETMLNSCGDDAVLRDEKAAGVPWAKSGGPLRPRHSRRFFRHELVSLLMLLGDGRAVLDGVAEPDLVRYLVAAHHGRVRVSIRSLPGEVSPSLQARIALGVCDGDKVDAVEIPGGEVAACTLDLAPMELGDGPGGEPSWTTRALALRDRADLGPFRLAFLEAIVRLADWRASASYEEDR